MPAWHPFWGDRDPPQPGGRGRAELHTHPGKPPLLLLPLPADLHLLEGLVQAGDLVLLVEGRPVAEEADDGAVGQAEEPDFGVGFPAGRGPSSASPAGAHGSLGRESGEALDDVGQLEAGRQSGRGESPAALGAIPSRGGLSFLAAPVLGDAAAAEVVLAAEADGLLVEAQADRAQQLVFQAAARSRDRHGGGGGGSGRFPSPALKAGAPSAREGN